MTNEQLCTLAHSGNSNAQTQLYLNLLPNIQQMASKFANEFSSLNVEAEDLVQEGSFGFLRAIGGFQSAQNVLFWTCAQKAVQNAMLDYIRGLQSEYQTFGMPQSFYESQANDEFSDDDLLDRIPDQQIKTPEQIRIEKESMKEIFHALSSIAPRESTYLYYRYGFGIYDEHDRKSAAEHFHLNTNRAKNWRILLWIISVLNFHGSIDDIFSIYLHSTANLPIWFAWPAFHIGFFISGRTRNRLCILQRKKQPVHPALRS